MNKSERDARDFDKWTGQWEKAMDDGLFDGAPDQLSPSRQSTTPSFFGPIDMNDTAEVKDCDAEYWNKVYKMSDNSGQAPDVILTENKWEPTPDGGKTAIPDKRGIADATEVAKVVQAMAKSPNPIRQASAGKDQALEPQQLSQTFSEEDIAKLHELKIQLHNAQVLLSVHDMEGKSPKSQEDKIATLKAKVDDLSDTMTQMWPQQISAQGD